MNISVVVCLVCLVGNIAHTQESAGQVDVCSKPIEIGECKAAFPKYAYDPKEGCIKFDYGGCGGNANNFDTLEECQAKCGGKL